MPKQYLSDCVAQIYDVLLLVLKAAMFRPDSRVYNNIIANDLPPAWSSIETLRILMAYNNVIPGTLPPGWSTLTDLRILYVGTACPTRGEVLRAATYTHVHLPSPQ